MYSSFVFSSTQEFVSLRSACLSTPPQLALIRSLTLVSPTLFDPPIPLDLSSNSCLALSFLILLDQSTIYSPASNLILHVYPLPWLVQTYFLETALVPPGLLHSVVELAQDDFPRPWGRQNEGGTGREGPTLGEAVGVFQQRVSGVSMRTWREGKGRAVSDGSSSLSWPPSSL